MNCRHCASPLIHTFVDLGFAPPSNAYLTSDRLHAPEIYYPLKTMVCEHCWLVQTMDYAQADELFSADYAYFSSTSSGWLSHASNFSDLAIERFSLGSDSLVIEIASNDGYLLKNFVSVGIPCLGIEPTDSTATAAEELGIPVLRRFFGESLAAGLSEEGKLADLVVGNNVYAHVPDINDFTRGMKSILKSRGTISLEFPHIMRLIDGRQFDTIYHEHFSYLSLGTVCRIFNAAGLRVCDVEQLPTHGGSLRVYGCHGDDPRRDTEAVRDVVDQEIRAGLTEVATYQSFQNTAEQIKNDLLTFLIERKRAGEKVVAYGAAAKGNTLLNFSGIRQDLVSVVYDAALSKQGKFMPGSHIPILPADELEHSSPDYVLIFPWNIVGEILRQQRHLLEKGVKFVTAVPKLEILQ